VSAELLFLTVPEVLALHKDQLRLFGGADGIRDAACSVARPRTLVVARRMAECVPAPPWYAWAYRIERAPRGAIRYGVGGEDVR